MENHDWSDEWRGLEPEQPNSGRCGCWIGVFMLLLVLISSCFGTAYFAWRQLGLPADPGTVLGRPTIPALSTLPAGDGDAFGTPNPGPAATQAPFVATVTLPSAGEPNEPEQVEARLIVSAPVIDGNLAEWADVTGYESSYRVFNINGWDRTDDVLAFWRLGWDQNNLYASVQVEDDIHVQTQQGNTIFQGDGVSLQIDTQREADYGTGLNGDDYQINLSPGDFARNPSAAYVFRGDSDGNLNDMPGHSVQMAALRTREGYTLEATIPWKDLGITPSPGMLLGIALNVNDNDTPGTAEQELMKSHIATRQFSDPTSWGTIILR